MAIIVPEMKDYTYKVVYKETDNSEEIVLSLDTRIIEATTTVINESGTVVVVPNPNYTFFMNPIMSNVTPIDNVNLIITRNPIMSVNDVTGDKEIIGQEKVVYTGKFNFLSYDYRSSILISDTKLNTSDAKKILVQILNINPQERIPCKYTVSGLEFATPISTEQHVDLSYKEISDTEYTTLGTNITVPSSGVLEPIQLGELPDDTQYYLKVYHHELKEEKEFLFTTNIVPTVGGNPIVGKVEWNGRILLLDAPDVKARMYPNNKQVDWMFPMDYSTKSFDNILSSLWSSITDSYNFGMKVSANNSNEVYVGCGITKTNYIGLPIDYVNEKLPDLGASMNIHYKDLFGVSADVNERRAIFMKFYIDTTHIGDVKLINFYDNTNEHFIGFKVDTNGDIRFIAFGSIYNIPAGVTITRGNWYSLVLIVKNNTILYASVTDYTNYSLAIIPINSGASVGNLSKARLFDAGRTPVTIEITYDATTVDEEHMGIAIEYATYQYIEDNDTNNLIDRGTTPYKTITNGTNQKYSFVVPNEAGYGIAIGYGIKFLYGGVTANGSVTITNFTVNGVSVMDYISTQPIIIDAECAAYMNGANNKINFIKTGDTIPNPIGGALFQNITVPTSISANQQPLVGGGINSNNETVNYYVAKFGFRKTIINGVDSWLNPYQYLDAAVFEMLGRGYKFMPKLRCSNINGEVNFISTLNMQEMKDATVRFLINNLPVGETTIEVMSNDESLSSATRIIKSVKMNPADVSYDIDFETNFDEAINEFKKRYYAKQKRWGGNMGGGTHGALIYFNRGLKCLILEQHGDNYRGAVPSVTQAGKEGYGFPVDIIEIPSSYPDQFSQRCARVGGLIQSIDYHPYGMFDCWFKVPKGMVGLAICLWYFHYQEIYDYDPTFDFWVNEGWNGYKYKDSVITSYGSKYFVINNEIDMELGSENTPYRVSVNPNSDRSLMWFVPGLSYRQAVGCTKTGADYGTWMIDWEASKARIEAVTSTDPQDSASYLYSNELVWVHVSDTFDDVNYGATTRSCRFNNWVNERWNDGCAVTSVAGGGLGKEFLSINNRTPLGELIPKTITDAMKYVEHYYDDGEYHKWSIDWTKDYTKLLIDDVEIAILKAFVPFNPMTMLVGCWFPSANIYDKGCILGEYGTWAGVNANWQIAHMYVKRIKFVAYTEEQVPINEMRYDCETYAEDGLKKIL